MKNRALYSLIPLAVLVGCSLFRPDSDDRNRPTTAGTYKCFERDKCRVTVTVTACSATGITANPNTLKVSSKVGRVPIVWKLHAPAGFSFSTDGINFKNKDLASKQFLGPRVSSHEFVWEDANTAYGTFPYNIRVKQGERDCPMHDPVVVNDD